ncbi:MAG: PAS domain S-box protein [Vulcanimicrobiota bacterium]
MEKKKTILLVEDEAIIAMSEAAALRDEGYEVLLSYSGRDAVEKARSAHHSIDLILMDIDLGCGIDGTEAAIEILDERDIPVIFLSSHSEREVVDKTEQITSYGYVMKSSGETVLNASIKMAFRLHEANNRLHAKHAHLEAVTEELTEKEAKYRFLTEKMNDIIWTADMDLHITYISPSVEKTLGYNPHEWMSLDLTRQTTPESLSIIRELITEQLLLEKQGIADPDKTVKMDIENYHKDGSKRKLENIISAIRDEQGNLAGFYGVARDVTERRKAEEELERTRALLEAAVEQSPAGIIIANAPDLKTIKINSAGLTIRGLKESVLKDIPLEMAAERWQTYNTDGSPCAPEDLPLSRAVLKGETVREQEGIIRREDGDRWVLATAAPVRSGSGRIIAGITVFQDITERRKMEEALRFSEERWQFALEGAGDGMWDWNTQTDRVFYSRQWKAMLGYDEHEIGNTLDEWDSRVHSDDRDMVYSELQRHLEGSAPIYISEHRIRCKDGTYKWILDRGKIVSRMEDGKPLRLVGSHTDISERKRIEEELKKSISAKETLMRELQHRVKNNLNIVSSLLGIEISRLRDESAKEIFKSIRSRIHSMSELYNEVYKSCDIDHVNLREYISSIAGAIIEINGEEAGKINLVTSLEDIHLDIRRAVPLSLILNELITNSIKYAYPLGREGEIRVSLDKSGEMISLCVSDDGPGVSEGFSVEKSKNLGLGLVSMLAEQLSGHFSIGNENGMTACITFKE